MENATGKLSTSGEDGFLRIAPGIFIDPSEVKISYIRASGPGGQHVNKAATAAQLRFDAGASSSLDEKVRERLLRLAGRRAATGGILVITARRFRSRERNRIDAIERLRRLVQRAASPPAFRRPTRPPAASKERRLDEKRRRGVIKRRRRPVRGAQEEAG